jgi:thiamine pyrophosphokinase
MFYGLLFANGEVRNGPAIATALSLVIPPTPRLVIGVDGGLHHLESFGLTPDIVIGDFDSADPAALERLKYTDAEIVALPTHKDETDLEAALLLAARRGCEVIRIFGALGNRLDQTLGNIYLLALPALKKRDVRLVDGAQTSWLAQPGTTIVQGAPGDTVSLIPLTGDVTGIETGELEYPLRNETLAFGPARGVSNVMLRDEARVHFETGHLLIVHTVGRA